MSISQASPDLVCQQPSSSSFTVTSVAAKTREFVRERRKFDPSGDEACLAKISKKQKSLSDIFASQGQRPAVESMPDPVL